MTALQSLGMSHNNQAFIRAALTNTKITRLYSVEVMIRALIGRFIVTRICGFFPRYFQIALGFRVQELCIREATIVNKAERAASSYYTGSPRTAVIFSKEAEAMRIYLASHKFPVHL